ncbi:MAG: substrate-binding domain-containing protein [Phycisphaerae bacterium]|nr:substrate-binding domain-containing protein [Phycisphaerae bacterium]
MSPSEITYKSKAVKLSGKLLRDIFRGDFIPGTRLPTQEDLARKYGASRPTIRRALDLLAEEHPVVKELQEGAAVPYRDGETLRMEPSVVTMLFFGSLDQFKPSRFGNELMGCMTGRFARKGELFRIHLMDDGEDSQRVIKELIRQNPPAVTAYFIRSRHLHFIHRLRRAGIPCLQVFPNLAEYISPCLTIQNEQVVRRQVEHLVRLGHRRIAYLHDVSGEIGGVQLHRARRDAFCRLCLEYSLDVSYDWVRFSRQDGKDARFQVRDIMTKPGAKPTAFIIYDEHVNPAYAALRECGYVPGEDISVIGADDMPWSAHVDPPLTTISVSRMRAAEMACEMMDELTSGNDPGVRYLETELVARNSTGPVSTETKR